jgi:hypothetical protein
MDGYTKQDRSVSNICPLCGEEVTYPDGVYLRGGKEAHIVCIQKARKEAQQKG